MENFGPDVKIRVMKKEIVRRYAEKGRPVGAVSFFAEFYIKQRSELELRNRNIRSDT